MKFKTVENDNMTESNRIQNRGGKSRYFRIIVSVILAMVVALSGIAVIVGSSVNTYATVVDQTGTGSTSANGGSDVQTNTFAQNAPLQEIYLDPTEMGKVASWYYSDGSEGKANANNASNPHIYKALNGGGDVYFRNLNTLPANGHTNYNESWYYLYPNAAVFPDGTKGDVKLTYTLTDIYTATNGAVDGDTFPDKILQLVRWQSNATMQANSVMHTNPYAYIPNDNRYAGMNTSFTKSRAVTARLTAKIEITNAKSEQTYLLPFNGFNAGKATTVANSAWYAMTNLHGESYAAEAITIAEDTYIPDNSDMVQDGDTLHAVYTAMTGNDGNYNSGGVAIGANGTVVSMQITGGVTYQNSGTNSPQGNNVFLQLGDLQYRYESGSGDHGKIETGKSGTGTDLEGGTLTDTRKYVVPYYKSGVTYTMTANKGYTADTITVDGAQASNPDKMKPGDTQTLTTNSGSGTLKYVGNGVYTFKFDDPAISDSKITVTWKKATFDIKAYKFWNDAKNAAGKRSSGTLELESDDGVTHTPVSLPMQDGKNLVEGSTSGYTWTDLPIYTYDTNGDADQVITYTIKENADPINTYYSSAEWSAQTSFDMSDSGGNKCKDTTESGVRVYYNQTDGITVTNKGKKDIEIKKIWDDAVNGTEDYYGNRPDAADTKDNYEVHIGSTTGALVTADADGNALTPEITRSGNSDTVKFKNLPVADSNDTEITYYIKEKTVPAGYETSSDTAKENGTITNTIKTTTLKVTKIWDDNGYSGRPTTDAFKNALGLYMSEKGQDSFSKVSDSADADTGNPYVTSDPGNTNKYIIEWKNLPAYRNKKEQEYKAKEDSVPTGYKASTSEYFDDEITNSMAKDVAIIKKWSDDNNKYSNRPDGTVATVKSMFTLYDGDPDATVPGTAVDVDDSNIEVKVNNDGWTIIWKNVPSADSSGPITYFAKETGVSTGYEISGSDKVEAKKSEDILNYIINKPISADLTVKKLWDDEENEDGQREVTTVSLWKKVGSGGSWTDTGKTVNVGTAPATEGSAFDLNAGWDDLAAYENKQVVYYKVEEATASLAAKGYKTTYTFGGNTVSDTDGINLLDTAGKSGTNKEILVTNKYERQKAKIVVNKKWVDGNNAQNLRTDLTFTLTATIPDGSGTKNVELKYVAGTDKGNTVTSKSLTTKADGSVEWDNLPVMKDGEKITYTVTETGADSAYKTSYSPKQVTLNNNETATIDVTNVLTVSEEKTVTRTITFTYLSEDGETASKTVVQTLTFTRTGTYDPISGTVDYTGSQWMPKDGNDTFPAVKAPEISGWKPNIEEVPALKVTDPDITIADLHVVYTQESTDPTPGDSSGSGNSGDSGDNTDSGDTDSDSGSGVKTGDSNNLISIMLSLIIAGFGIGGIAVSRRSRRNRDKA